MWKSFILWYVCDLTVGCDLPSSRVFLYEAIRVIVSQVHSLIDAPKEFLLNGVHVALFKLCATKKTIETRIYKLTAQADGLKEQALKQKKMGNEKLALTHLKRKQVIMNEIDLCSASLLNLETAYVALDRSGTDIQLFKSYELIQKTMKEVREENGLDQSIVENVMDEIAEENEGLQRVNDALSYMGTGFDETELEEELMKLQHESGNPSDDPSNGGKSSNVSMKGDKSHEDDIVETPAHHFKSDNNIPEAKQKTVSQLVG